MAQKPKPAPGRRAKATPKPPAVSVPTRVKKPNGRPPHAPTDSTRAMVQGAKAIGFTEDQIGALIGIATTTLRIHYVDELANGADRVNYAIASNMARIAMSNTHPQAVRAGEAWLRNRLGWTTTGSGPAVSASFTTPGAAGAPPTTFTVKIGDLGGGGDPD